MKSKITILILFFILRPIFSSEYVECNFEANIESLAGAAVNPTKDKNYISQKATFSINKITYTVDDAYCDKMKDKKQYTAAIRLNKGDKPLKIGQTVSLRFVHIVSEVVKKGYVADMTSSEVWYLIEGASKTP